MLVAFWIITIISAIILIILIGMSMDEQSGAMTCVLILLACLPIFNTIILLLGIGKGIEKHIK